MNADIFPSRDYRQDSLHTLILGGQKSGKSRHAEWLAQQWLAQSPKHAACMVATGQAFDAQMQARIARHRQERALRVPGMVTLEEPMALAATIDRHSCPNTLLVVDCLTMWLTNWLMPMPPQTANAALWQQELDLFLDTLMQVPGPVVMVSNEVGWGVIPLGEDVRRFVDALGSLNQHVARRCGKVMLVAAGMVLPLQHP